MKHINTNAQLQKLHNEQLQELSQEDIENIQHIILSMIADLDQYFQKHDIHYYLGGGSALGSIRHQGFIPWDEDMDINMLSADIDKLANLFKTDSYLSEKYYFCENDYDHEFDVNFARIKLKGTSFKEYLYKDYSKDGIFIDIFPVENVPDNKLLRNIQGFFVTSLLFICSCVRIKDKKELYLNFQGDDTYTSGIQKKVRIGKIFAFRSLNKWLKSSKKMMRKCKNQHSQYITVPTGKRHYFGEMYKREDIFPVVYKKFNDIELPVARHNEIYMSKMFGDYMKIPAVEDRERHFICSYNLGEYKTKKEE